MSIQFNMNTQKAIEAVLWVIHNGESNMYNVWKILFSADKYHLNKYGRPVTGDRYMAMEFGTVPSWLYDATKIKRQGIGFIKDNNSLIPERTPMLDYLSQSDIEALKYGLNEYAGIEFKSTCESYRHNDDFTIPFEGMIEEEWLKEDLTLMAHNMVL